MNLACNVSRQVGLVTALVNLAIPGQEGGATYQPPPAAQIAARFGELLTPQAAGELLDVTDPGPQLIRLATDLHRALLAPDIATTADRLNTLIARCAARPYLTDDVGQPYHLHFHGTRGSYVQALGGELATALALVIDMLGDRRFGACTAHNCDRVYVDLTRNNARRYCSDACAARAKTAAYRARKTQDRSPTPAPG
jgi:predicted RNA-binding Zn ribbon-like protein